MQKFICPHCHLELTKELYRKKVLFVCPGCGGQFVTVSALRGLCQSKEFINRLWRSALHSQAPGITCPSCRKNMRQVLLYPDITLALELDVCCSCQAVWCDPAELENIPVKEIAEDTLPPEAREIIAAYAIARVKEISQDNASSIGGFWDDSPYSVWKVIPILLGLPVEQDSDDLQNLPFITWSTAVLCIAVFLLSFQDLSAVISSWGFIPSQMFRHGGLTWISSMFLHSGWLHLLSNMYFLLVFGDNVEDEFGHWKYLLLIFLSGICASLTHLLFDLRSTVPCVGASGFISAVLACYAICFPKRLINVGIGKYIFAFRWASLPAWAVFGIWLIGQIVLSAAVDPHGGGTAYFAHLGGAAAGVITAVIYRLKRRNDPPFPSLYQTLRQEPERK